MARKIFVNEKTADNVEQTSYLSYLKRNWLVVLIVCTVALGVFGSGLSYLERDAQEQMRANNHLIRKEKDQTLLNQLNPFLEPLPTPQISKEYIYAGSKLLAVEDANAAVAPSADLAVWRPSSGTWWVMGGSNSQQVNFNWGTNGDFPVPGDYDGDGKTDFSIFRPASSAWWIYRSSDNTFYSSAFGTSGDKPAQADYDGDGKTDAAVFRPSNGTWYLQGTATGFSSQQFGLANDTPAPADYDGDGKADLAVWRSSAATFYSLNSNNNQLVSAVFAAASSEPVSADYDGDGRADYAIRSGINWHIKNSSNNQIQIIAWQQAADSAVHNDYDGDGKVDIATWKSANGDWYIRQSSRIGQTNELRQEHWGQAGDIPVPAYYRR